LVTLLRSHAVRSFLRNFFRVWLILAPAYLVITVAVSYIVSGTIVYPAETLAHILIVPFLQAAVVAPFWRKGGQSQPR